MATIWHDDITDFKHLIEKYLKIQAADTQARLVTAKLLAIQSNHRNYITDEVMSAIDQSLSGSIVTMKEIIER